jgi:hypothetical protein
MTIDRCTPSLIRQIFFALLLSACLLPGIAAPLRGEKTPAGFPDTYFDFTIK